MQKKLLYFMTILLLILGLATGCIEKEPLEENDPHGNLAGESETKDLRSFFPTKPGMIYIFAGEGNEYASFTREIKFAEGSKVQFHDDNGGTVIARIYAVEKNQIIQVFEEAEFYGEVNALKKTEDDETPDQIILKTPIEQNIWWESGNMRREIVDLVESITVPAGTFYDIVKVKVTSTENEAAGETYEYFARNVGLILREFHSGDTKVVSRLESYGMKSILQTAEDDKKSVAQSNQSTDISNPELILLAYQLDHELRSIFESAYESYINLDKLTDHNEKNFEQILAIYRASLDQIAVSQIVDSQVKRLKEYYNAGEGEVTFPTHEVVQGARVLKRNSNSAEVALSITKYYPAREWSGKAHNQTFSYNIELVKEDQGWKLKTINGETINGETINSKLN